MKNVVFWDVSCVVLVITSVCVERVASIVRVARIAEQFSACFGR
jgi:hypothetical protein